MPGWFPCDADSWPLVVEALQRLGEPWPYDLTVEDLAWWDDQVRFTANHRRPVKRPGRPTLAKRWGGVSDRQVRNALRDPAWRDRQKQGDPADSEWTTDGQDEYL